MAKYSVVLNTENIKKMMQLRDWTQADLAKETGLTPAAISQIFSGERLPSLNSFYSLYKVLGLPVRRLIKEP